MVANFAGSSSFFSVVDSQQPKKTASFKERYRSPFVILLVSDRERGIRSRRRDLHLPARDKTRGKGGCQYVFDSSSEYDLYPRLAKYIITNLEYLYVLYTHIYIYFPLPHGHRHTDTHGLVGKFCDAVRQSFSKQVGLLVLHCVVRVCIRRDSVPTNCPMAFRVSALATQAPIHRAPFHAIKRLVAKLYRTSCIAIVTPG